MARSRRSVALMYLLWMVANGLDAAFTLWWWEAGLSDELNPFWKMMLQINPRLSMLSKVVVVNIIIGWLWYQKAHEYVPLLVYLVSGSFIVALTLHTLVLCGLTR